MYTFASRAAACVRAACASERRPHAAKTFPASRPVERERAYFVSSTSVDGTTRRSRTSCLAGIDECQIDGVLLDLINYEWVECAGIREKEEM